MIEQDPNYHADFCSGCGYKTCKCKEPEPDTITISREDADKIVELLGETESNHRDRDSCDYNECDIKDEECLWCAEARPIIAALEAK